MIRWVAGSMGQSSYQPSFWCSKCYFFHNILQNSLQKICNWEKLALLSLYTFWGKCVYFIIQKLENKTHFPQKVQKLSKAKFSRFEGARGDKKPDILHHNHLCVPHCPNVSTTLITAIGCRKFLPLSVVQLKGKHCRIPHCCNGVVDTFEHYKVNV